jgi:hypothetical protein
MCWRQLAGFQCGAQLAAAAGYGAAGEAASRQEDHQRMPSQLTVSIDTLAAGAGRLGLWWQVVGGCEALRRQ